MATDGKNLSAYNLSGLPDLSHKRVAICYAAWNAEITHGLRDGALEVLSQVIDAPNLVVHEVPGTYELALGAQFLFATGKIDAVVCVGSVIRGETAHFDYVCQAASQGIMTVGLKHDAPCIFCVLTDDNIEQSRARSGGIHGNKGVESAMAALEMLSLKDSLS